VEIVVRATVIFWFLWLVTRGLGKRELAEMSPFELILIVTMGDLVQQGVTQEDFSVTGAILAISTLALWILLLAWFARRSTRARLILDGAPVVLVHEGALVDEVLEQERVDADDVAEAARTQGIGDLALVRYGILEPDGRFSFIRYDNAAAQAAPEAHKA
jgi:uncharacterized membrane protein YcaP (DUF421 family)